MPFFPPETPAEVGDLDAVGAIQGCDPSDVQLIQASQEPPCSISAVEGHDGFAGHVATPVSLALQHAFGQLCLRQVTRDPNVRWRASHTPCLLGPAFVEFQLKVNESAFLRSHAAEGDDSMPQD